MRRRNVLQTLASASIASTAVGSVAANQDETELTIEKEKRSQQNPLLEEDISKIRSKAVTAHVKKHGQRVSSKNQGTSGDNDAVIVPEHDIPESSNVVSYLFSVTPEGRTQFYLGTIEQNPSKTDEIDTANNSSTTQNDSLDMTEADVSAEKKHSEMDQFEDKLKTEYASVSESGSRTTNNVTTTQVDECESWRDFRFENWGCPVAGGKVSIGGYPHGNCDEYTNLHQLEGNWFAAGTDLLLVPGTNEWGTEWYNHIVDFRHEWQENAFDDGEAKGWWPYDTSSGDLTSISAGLNAGPDGVGASIGASWETADVAISNSHNSTQGSWNVDVNNNRGSSFQSTYTTVFKFDSTPLPDDQLVATDIDCEWGKTCVEDYCLSGKTYSSSTDYRYQQIDDF
jgi:hypothetical protein